MLLYKKNTKKRLTPKEQPPKKNKKGLASVILAPIRLKFELVIYILTEVDNFVKKKIKKFNNLFIYLEKELIICYS